MVDLSKYSSQNWKEIEGVYYSDQTFDLSYPDEGNDLYMTIEENSYWFRHRNRIISEKVTSMVSEKLFFDIGGGNGYVARGLVKEGIETILIEPGRVGAMNARKRGLNQVLCTTLEGAAINEGTIPAAGLFDVLEHIEDDFDFLKKVWTVLKDDGLLFITVPAYSALWSPEDDYAGHYRRYKMEDLFKLTSEVGYKVEYFSYIFAWLPPLIYVIRVLPAKMGLHRSNDSGKTAAKEHAEGQGLLKSLIRSLLNWELRRIERGKRIPFGSSCFIVLRKIDQSKHSNIQWISR